MNYYYDCEFLEGKQDMRFLGIKYGETNPTIDLISIGIVSEDGREYYAISKDFNLKDAWNRCDTKLVEIGENKYRQKVYWVRDNVLKTIWRELLIRSEQEWYAYASNAEYDGFLLAVKNGEYDIHFNFKSIKRLIEKYGKTNEQIAEEIKYFCKALYRNYSIEGEGRFTEGSVGWGINPCSDEDKNNYGYKFNYPNSNPVLYGYYSAYDHVVFCWLFGKMIDLPEGFPMYTRDLKQILDDTLLKYCENKVNPTSLEDHLKSIKSHPNYPKQENDHSAIHDARWNKKLHEFLKSL